MKLRLTPQADQDVEDILIDTIRLFGSGQMSAYATIMQRGLDLLEEDPTRPASKHRTDIRVGLRSFHLQLAAKRSGGASHVIYYRVVEPGDACRQVQVLRILSDKMDPRRRVISAMKSN